MPAPGPAVVHHAVLRQLAVDAAHSALAQWDKVNPDDIAASWLRQLPNVAGLLTLAQRAAAGQADPFLAQIAPEALAQALVQASAFAGSSADGRSLVGLLFAPVTTTLKAIFGGVLVDKAMAAGAAKLDTVIRSEVFDAGRAADQVALTARPELAGYVRVVVGETCSRCIVLAGRWYRSSEGFRRHPGCDCVMVPAAQADAASLVQDPQEIYDALTPAERTAAGWSEGDQYAIDSGADIFQVTNVRRSTSLAGLRPTRSRARGRLTPDAILVRANGDRDKAIELLRRHGYLWGTGNALPAKAKSDAIKLQEILANVESRRPLGSGEYSRTELITLKNGEQYVYKDIKYDTEDLPAKHQVDAEILGAHMARAAGLQAPTVYRASKDELYMTFMDGELVADALLYPGNSLGDRIRSGEIARSADGHALRLLDILIDNADRHDGNWLVDDGENIQAIDHGLAWLNESLIGEPPLFNSEMLLGFADGSGVTFDWIDNPLSPEDVTTVTQRITALKPEFERLDRLDWWRYSLDRLEVIGQHARGTERLIR